MAHTNAIVSTIVVLVMFTASISSLLSDCTCGGTDIDYTYSSTTYYSDKTDIYNGGSTRGDCSNCKYAFSLNAARRTIIFNCCNSCCNPGDNRRGFDGVSDDFSDYLRARLINQGATDDDDRRR